MEQPGKLIIEPIGVVHNEIQESRDASFDWSGITSQIKLEDSYFNYTRGLEEYSHIWVIFWINRASKKELVAEIHPKGDQTLPLVGVFASRSPNRPNPVGLKLAEVIHVEGNIITVKSLDALNGTPVIDIKPYSPGYDSASEFRVSPWSSKSQNN